MANKKANNYDLLFGIVVSLLVTTTLYFHYSSDNDKNKTAIKKFTDFESFYPYYLTQHTNEICRRLHVIGVSVLTVMIVLDFHILVSSLIAISLSLPTFYLTTHIETGFVELSVLFLTFLLSMRYFKKSWKKGVSTLFIMYAFAWIGHFFFEKNKPATFIYPTFSMMGDARLWFDTVTLAKPF